MKVPDAIFVATPSAEGKLPDVIRGRILAHLRRYARAPQEIRIRPYKAQRSGAQNAYWHAVPVDLIAEHCGYTHDQMHYALLGEWGGYIDGPHGKPVPRCASSSKLTTEEFSKLIEWVLIWGPAEMGVIIPSPNEW